MSDLVARAQGWTSRWREALERTTAAAGEIKALNIESPAPESALLRVEAAIGSTIPAAFRAVLGRFAAIVDFDWCMPDDFEFPEPFQEIASGGCHWSLGRLIELETRRRGWVSKVFTDPDDPYDAVWHEKLAFLDIVNGDMLGLDLHPDRHGSVVYMSQDDGLAHGYRLGADFADFIDRWSELGCPGAEEVQLLPFLEKRDGLLQHDSELAAAWRDARGMARTPRP